MEQPVVLEIRGRPTNSEQRSGDYYGVVDAVLQLIGVPQLRAWWERALRRRTKILKAGELLVIDALPDDRKLMTTTMTGIVIRFSVIFKCLLDQSPFTVFLPAIDQCFIRRSDEHDEYLGTGEHMLYVSPHLHNTGNRKVCGGDLDRVWKDFRAKFADDDGRPTDEGRATLTAWWQEHVRDLQLTLLPAMARISLLRNPDEGPPVARRRRDQDAVNAAWAVESKFHIMTRSRRIDYSIRFQFSDLLLFLNAVEIPGPDAVELRDPDVAL